MHYLKFTYTIPSKIVNKLFEYLSIVHNVRYCRSTCVLPIVLCIRV